MKWVSLYSILLFSQFTVFSQNASLTKAETVDYINKRIHESTTLGLLEKYNSKEGKWAKRIYNYNENRINLENGNQLICHFDYWVGWNFAENTTINRNELYYGISGTKNVNITRIKDITLELDSLFEDSPLAFLTIHINGNFARGVYNMKKYCSYCSTDTETVTDYNLNSFGIPIIKEDFEKIKKALLYLRDLVKAEDPFGN